MKKATLTSLLLVIAFTFGFAQQKYYLFELTSTKKADIVLKAINSELLLGDETYNQVRDLLYESAKGQEEASHRSTPLSPEQADRGLMRQTMHIENALHAIIGDALFVKYTAHKQEIETSVKAANTK